MIKSLLILAFILTSIAYAVIFYKILEYDIYYDQCEKWEERDMMMPAGKILIPGKSHVCMKWK